MRTSTLLLRNLTYFWRTNLAVVLGVAAAEVGDHGARRAVVGHGRMRVRDARPAPALEAARAVAEEDPDAEGDPSRGSM